MENDFEQSGTSSSVGAWIRGLGLNDEAESDGETGSASTAVMQIPLASGEKDRPEG